MAPAPSSGAAVARGAAATLLVEEAEPDAVRELLIAEPVAEADEAAPEISDVSELLTLETTELKDEAMLLGAEVRVLKRVETGPLEVKTWEPLVTMVVPLMVEMAVRRPPVPVPVPVGVGLAPEPEGTPPAADDRML